MPSNIKKRKIRQWLHGLKQTPIQRYAKKQLDFMQFQLFQGLPNTSFLFCQLSAPYDSIFSSVEPRKGYVALLFKNSLAFYFFCFGGRRGSVIILFIQCFYSQGRKRRNERGGPGSKRPHHQRNASPCASSSRRSTRRTDTHSWCWRTSMSWNPPPRTSISSESRIILMCSCCTPTSARSSRWTTVKASSSRSATRSAGPVTISASSSSATQRRTAFFTYRSRRKTFFDTYFLVASSHKHNTHRKRSKSSISRSPAVSVRTCLPVFCLEFALAVGESITEVFERAIMHQVQAIQLSLQAVKKRLLAIIDNQTKTLTHLLQRERKKVVCFNEALLEE